MAYVKNSTDLCQVLWRHRLVVLDAGFGAELLIHASLRTTKQTVQPGGVRITQQKTSYDFGYDYAGAHPHAATHIDIRTYTYDANGNETGWTNDLNGTRRTVVWDEENRVQKHLR
jgi:hypothetical protein